MKLRLWLLLLVALPGCAMDRTCRVERNGCEVIEHSNPLPVVVHRLFPPYGIGKHVYVR